MPLEKAICAEAEAGGPVADHMVGQADTQRTQPPTHGAGEGDVVGQRAGQAIVGAALLKRQPATIGRQAGRDDVAPGGGAAEPADRAPVRVQQQYVECWRRNDHGGQDGAMSGAAAMQDRSETVRKVAGLIRIGGKPALDQVRHAISRLAIFQCSAL